MSSKRSKDPGPSGAKPSPSVDELVAQAKAARGGQAAELYAQAAELTRGEDDMRAAELYEQAIERANEGPAEPRAVAKLEIALGELYQYELGRIDRAMAHYQQAYKLDPDDPMAIEAGRRIFATHGDFQAVARLYEVELES